MQQMGEDICDPLSLLPDKIERCTAGDLMMLLQSIDNKDVTLEMIRSKFKCRREKIHAEFVKHGLQIKTRRGRPHTKITVEQIRGAKEYRLKYNVGYKRLAAALSAQGIPTTTYAAQLIYELEGLYLYEQPYHEEELHTNRFVARYANQLWHTDLHTWEKIESNGEQKQTYLIAFLDDRTRRLMHIEIINDKSMISSSNAFNNALMLNPKPHMLTIDNGKEFIGINFQDILSREDIKQHRIHPGNPEENGKIERFWGTIDRALKDRTKIEEFVREYNTVWPHSSLKALTGKSMTPQQAWDEMDHY
jgi:transposase InsO family protein